VGAQDDAALDLVAEACSAGGRHDGLGGDGPRRRFDPQAVTHPPRGATQASARGIGINVKSPLEYDCETNTLSLDCNKLATDSDCGCGSGQNKTGEGRRGPQGPAGRNGADGISITDVILGGPVWKGKLLEVGDMILKVGQGTQEPVDVVGMRLDDAVKLIKGPKGTEVRLTVKRVDGTIEVVPIIRDVVEIEETYAKSVVILSNGKRYGLIYLPKFYINFEDTNQRNAATDVALEIEKRKKKKSKP